MSIENMINKVKQEVKHDVESIRNLGHHKEPLPSPDHEPGKEHLHEKRKAVNDYAHKKIIELADDFHGHLPIFESVGYKLKRFEVELGISPKLHCGKQQEGWANIFTHATNY